MRLTKGYVQTLGMGSRFVRPHRMQRIGFAPWKPLPPLHPLIDDPDWDVETFHEQAERLAGPDDGGDEGPAL